MPRKNLKKVPSRRSQAEVKAAIKAAVEAAVKAVVKAKSDPTDLRTGAGQRANLRRLSGSALEAQRESLRRRPTGRGGRTRLATADEALRKIDVDLGDAQHRYQLRKQKRDKEKVMASGKKAGKAAKRRSTRAGTPSKHIRVPLSAEAALANIKADLKTWEREQAKLKRGAKKGK